MTDIGVEVYLRPVDAADGQRVVFTGAVRVVEVEHEGTKRQDYSAEVQHEHVVKWLRLNATSRRWCGAVWGREMEAWKGKVGELKKSQLMIGDKMRDVIYVRPAPSGGAVA